MTFRKLCEKIAEETGLEIDFYKEKGRKKDAFHDDGTLHVISRGVRACFWVGQDDNTRANERTRAVLKMLDIEPNDRTLLDETEDDDCCPHCGHEL